jgi:prephenate dehydrogenase
MARNKPLVSIIGIGLLGGSLALALRRAGGYRLTGWSPSALTRARARKFMPIAPNLPGAVRDADIVVIGAPSGTVVALLRRILPLLKPGALVMDMASVKDPVARGARRLRGAVEHFVPCHPMAGKEKTGVWHADPSLYRGRRIFLVPYPKTPRSLSRRAASLWKSAGGVPTVMRAADHDRRVAVTSHLPHLVACAVTEAYGNAWGRDKRVKEAVGTGFQDVTRIAASGAGMWVDIVEMNAKELRKILSRFRRRLSELEKDLRPGRRARWNRFFAKVRDIREKLG